MRVESRHVEAIAKDRKPTVDHAAADAQIDRELPLVVPDDLPGAAIDRPGVIVESGDVHGAVDHDRRGLELVAAARAETRVEGPHRRETCDILRRDLSKRAVS